MTIHVKDLFRQCEFPFYKELEIHDHYFTCTLYSIYSNYKKFIRLDMTDEGELLHQLALEIIKFRSEELYH